MPLVERALQVLERRAVQPPLGLLKSIMLGIDFLRSGSWRVHPKLISYSACALNL
ncbi:MAG TPA: hypothetical protein VMF91_23650 [Bryobacteraceae bacterium]|nr:hypothetical protein [Bryobacteraceae bacterium]